MTSGKGVTLDVWQRQAVLAAAALLRERFGMSPTDAKAKAVHDALLEVVEPKRRACACSARCRRPQMAPRSR